MKRFLLIMIAFIFSNVLFAQDLIILKTGDEIKAKVAEIGIDNVKYKKYDNLSGPVYTLKKSEIFMIKYENGDKDIFKDEEVKTDNTTGKKRAADMSASSLILDLLHKTYKIPTDNTTDDKKEDKDDDYDYGELVWSGKWWSNSIRSSTGKHLSRTKIRSIMADVPDALSTYNRSQRLQTTGTILGYSGIGLALAGLIMDMNSINNEDHKFVSIAGLGLLTVGVIFDVVGTSKEKVSLNIYKRAKNNHHTSLNFGPTNSGGMGFELTF
jgi:hypothetical protein